MKKISLFTCVLFITMFAHSQTLPQPSVFAENQSPGMEVSISPNPIKNYFVVKVNSVDFSQAQISVYNMVGKRLSVRDVELETGKNIFSYPGIDLFPGNYFVAVKTNKGSIVKKVTIE